MSRLAPSVIVGYVLAVPDGIPRPELEKQLPVPLLNFVLNLKLRATLAQTLQNLTPLEQNIFRSIRSNQALNLHLDLETLMGGMLDPVRMNIEKLQEAFTFQRILHFALVHENRIEWIALTRSWWGRVVLKMYYGPKLLHLLELVIWLNQLAADTAYPMISELDISRLAENPKHVQEFYQSLQDVQNQQISQMEQQAAADRDLLQELEKACADLQRLQESGHDLARFITAVTVQIIDLQVKTSSLPTENSVATPANELLSNTGHPPRQIE